MNDTQSQPNQPGAFLTSTKTILGSLNNAFGVLIGVATLMVFLNASNERLAQLNAQAIQQNAQAIQLNAQAIAELGGQLTQLRVDTAEGFAAVNATLDGMNKRLDSQDQRFETVDRRFEQVQASLADLSERVTRIEVMLDVPADQVQRPAAPDPIARQ